MGPADLKERLKHPKKESRPIPTLRFGYGNLALSYFFTRPLPRSREHASARLRAQAGNARFSGPPIQHRGAKG